MHDRSGGTLIGLAVGDALGAAVEFKSPGSFAPVTGYRSGGPHGLADDLIRSRASPSKRGRECFVASCPSGRKEEMTVPCQPDSWTRRQFLATTGGLLVGAASTCLFGEDNKPNATTLITDIERQVIFPGRQTETTWFHPRPCMFPSGDTHHALMTLQSISGSDVFGPVHWTISKDLGRMWSEPQPIHGLGRRKLDDEQEEGVCDVVPEYHASTNTVLAIGHNVYYRKGVLARPQESRWPVYVVRATDGSWSSPQKLNWDDPRGAFIYTCGCAQRVTLAGGEILIPLSFGPRETQPRSVTSVRCTFDGKQLSIRNVGSELTSSVGRGLLEPSLATLNGKCFITIRAEDERGYVSVSDDGLNWQKQQPWMWNDGQPLVMSTTQQRWLVHSDGLFLVYTRKAEQNAKVMRWRTPLFVAEVDRQTLRLIRESEQVVLPLVGDAVHVALMGNFHTVAASRAESWVTVGENRRNDGWKGDTLLARIRWSRPNRLVAG